MVVPGVVDGAVEPDKARVEKDANNEVDEAVLVEAIGALLFWDVLRAAAAAMVRFSLHLRGRQAGRTGMIPIQRSKGPWSWHLSSSDLVLDHHASP